MGPQELNLFGLQCVIIGFFFRCLRGVVRGGETLAPGIGTLTFWVGDVCWIMAALFLFGRFLAFVYESDGRK